MENIMCERLRYFYRDNYCICYPVPMIKYINGFYKYQFSSIKYTSLSLYYKHFEEVLDRISAARYM